MEAGCVRLGALRTGDPQNHVRTGPLCHAISNKPLEKRGDLEIEGTSMANNSVNHACVTKPQQKL